VNLLPPAQVVAADSGGATGDNVGTVELRDRIFGPITVPGGEEPSETKVDFGELVRKLILSEQVILESGPLLSEFPLLIAKFGLRRIVVLLKSGRLRIVADAVTQGQVG
jgi:hypothetical protein